MDYDETVFPPKHWPGNDLESRPRAAHWRCHCRPGPCQWCRHDSLVPSWISRAIRGWGRVEENFGEDPHLTGQLGLAYVQGMQGDSLNTQTIITRSLPNQNILPRTAARKAGSTPLRFTAGEREVRSIMLKSFEPARPRRQGDGHHGGVSRH